MTEQTSTRTPAAAAALIATVGLAAASWVVTARLMNGMDMGVPPAEAFGRFGKNGGSPGQIPATRKS